MVQYTPMDVHCYSICGLETRLAACDKAYLRYQENSEGCLDSAALRSPISQNSVTCAGEVIFDPVWYEWSLLPMSHCGKHRIMALHKTVE